MECLRIFIFILISFILIIPTITYNVSIDNSMTFNNISKHPEWLGILRELIFKTISPYPSLNNNLYKSFLEAPFYGSASTETVNNSKFTPNLIARGDVYYSPLKKGWIICQEDCTDCTECLLQSSSYLKWTLRQVRAQENFLNSTRHILQLTVIPQHVDSFHMKSLHRRSHIYVTPKKRLEQTTTNDIKMKRNKLGHKRSITAKKTLQGSKTLTKRNLTTDQGDNLLPISLTNFKIPTKLLSSEQAKHRHKKQFLRVVPMQLKLNRDFDIAPLKVSSSRNFSVQSNQYNSVTNHPLYSKIIEKLFLLFDIHKKPDDYDSSLTDLKNLYHAYENFIFKEQVEKDEEKINARNIFDKATLDQLKLRISSSERKLRATMSNKMKSMKKMESLKRLLRKKKKRKEIINSNLEKNIHLNDTITSALDGSKIERLKLQTFLNNQGDTEKELERLSEYSYGIERIERLERKFHDFLSDN